ncbi:DegT/DnrJ/EryC1/StrS family aminotransferase [Verrucomicrobium spinosum]|uniref:DegT/DnrJ/EryC1/StrS family aminotransferase n=1 Tax=Verrucomicrobium spinosum TaxID=2736 RepID=UPI0009D79719|nr:DegT/DnrJ/EryC1/StrS family aminotransferase [Verrucomicrobium spinosum]
MAPSIPLFSVFMSPEAIARSVEVLGCGFIGQGPQVEAFESKLKDWVTSPHVLTLNSGTSALHLALRLAGVEHGDEVISTAMTCMATNVPILANGARIVWADINPKTGNLCPKSVAEKITPKTKAIVCVDWGGYPCDFTELRAIADQHKIALIEDAAHAFGATYKNQKMAALPDFTTFSFQAIKHVTTVDGGALICRSEEDYKRGKLLRWYGIDRDVPRKDFRCEEDVLEFGYKFHMNDVAASIGVAQLDHAARIVGAHQKNGETYRAAFAGREERGLELLDYKDDRKSAFWLFTMLVDNREEFMKFMAERGITVSQVHARNDRHTVFRDFQTELPGVDAFSTRQVNLPVGWWLKEDQVQHIISTVDEFFPKSR